MQGLIKTKGEAQEDRLEILKTLVAHWQTSPRAVVAALQDVQDAQNKRLTSEPAAHNAAKRHCNVSQNAQLAGIPLVIIMQIGFPRWNGWNAQNHCPYFQFCLQQIKSKLFPCSNEELVKAYKTFWAAYRKKNVSRETDVHSNMFTRRPDTRRYATLTSLKKKFFKNSQG